MKLKANQDCKVDKPHAQRISDMVAGLEKELERVRVQVQTERASGQRDALAYVRTTNLYMMDGMRTILMAHGVSPVEAIAISDVLFDHIKTGLSRAYSL